MNSNIHEWKQENAGRQLFGLEIIFVVIRG
jgi:hypothetical protein